MPTASTTVGDYLLIVVERCIDGIEAAEPLVRHRRSSAAVDGVHDMRVSVRRLRAAFKIFRGVVPRELRKTFADEARWLGHALASARDWDVFIGETLPRLARSLEQATQREPIERTAARKRQVAYRIARAALDDPRYRAIKESFGDRLRDQLIALEPPHGGGALNAQVRSYAAQFLRKRGRKLRATASDITRLDVDALHELRLKIKELRYAMQFFRPIYGSERATRYLDALRDLQDALGAINDARVAAELVVEALRDARPPLDPARSAGIQASIERWRQRRVKKQMARLPKLWRRFRDQKLNWIDR
ncbi:MAG: CHAD domain-containing protein [Alphaproteobacteria bacterium]